jgi:hypothetical protein
MAVAPLPIALWYVAATLVVLAVPRLASSRAETGDPLDKRLERLEELSRKLGRAA